MEGDKIIANQPEDTDKLRGISKKLFPNMEVKKRRCPGYGLDFQMSTQLMFMTCMFNDQKINYCEWSCKFAWKSLFKIV